jgi:hypothetical protein
MCLGEIGVWSCAFDLSGSVQGQAAGLCNHDHELNESAVLQM